MPVRSSVQAQNSLADHVRNQRLTHPVSIADHGAVRVITVNRPDKLNALNAATLDALHVAFDAAADDASVRVVVLTGAGRRRSSPAPTSPK
jgi:enoyl-CoA hydratase/carnithine racemase